GDGLSVSRRHFIAIGRWIPRAIPWWPQDERSGTVNHGVFLPSSSSCASED
ncbi:hypothetical protein GW17_00009080, partial [Ensete ventricosum]